MYSFMMVSDCPSGDVQRVLKMSSEITRRLLPNLGRSLQTDLVELPEIDGGWFTLSIENDPWPPLLDTYLDDAVAVLTYGQTPDGARKVGEAVLARGATATYGLTGEFAAIVVNRRDRVITLTSTLLNRYIIRYTTDEGGSFGAASFEVSLVAAGLVPIDPDHVSLASMLKVEYGLNGYGFLHGVRGLRGYQPVQWTPQGRIHEPVGWRMEHETRIAPGDYEAMEQQNDLIEQIMVSAVAQQVHGSSRIKIDLTAGRDTRAVFGALLATGWAGRIECSTAGGANSPDAVAASRLAAQNGARFTLHSHDKPTDRFVENLDLLAFYMNGLTSGKRATVDGNYPDTFMFHAHGGGGEIFTDFYGAKSFPSTAGASGRMLREYLLQRPPANLAPGLQCGLAERLDETLDGLQSISSDAWDLAALLYTFERMPQWGAPTAVVPWWRDRYLPFFSTPLFVEAMRLPPPLSRTLDLHRRLILRHVRGGGWVPINQRERLLLNGDETWKNMLRWLDSNLMLRWHHSRIRRKSSMTGGRTIKRIRSDMFGERYAVVIRDILSSEQSCLSVLFGADRAVQLVDEHSDGKSDHTILFGIVLVMNRYLRMLYEARRMAKAATE